MIKIIQKYWFAFIAVIMILGLPKESNPVVSDDEVVNLSQENQSEENILIVTEIKCIEVERAEVVSGEVGKNILFDSRENKLANLIRKPQENYSGYITRRIYSNSEYDYWFEKYGSEYGVSSSTLKRIAYCESKFRVGAVSGSYGGMYQYLASTWRSTRKSMGMNEDPNLRFNPEEAIRTTAFKIASGGIGAWPVCGKNLVARI